WIGSPDFENEELTTLTSLRSLSFVAGMGSDCRGVLSRMTSLTALLYRCREPLMAFRAGELQPLITSRSRSLALSHIPEEALSFLTKATGLESLCLYDRDLN